MVTESRPEETLRLADEQATVEFGSRLSKSIATGVVYLEGLLGVGKTTVVRGWLNALDHHGTVKSPTYTIVEPYQLKGKTILHIDLYRIKDPVELEFTGLVEQISEADLVFIEWPQHGAGTIPSPDFTINLYFDGNGRQVSCVQSTHEE